MTALPIIKPLGKGTSGVFLKKVTAIKSVGRFKAAGISGGYYDRFVLVYGGNGRGKTTLCATLRSLQRNDPKLILRRKTFQATCEPEVSLLLDTGPVKFSGGVWTAPQPDIHIFDQQFVTENVHGGNQIEVEHRRRFYRIVVGPTGVALAEDIDQLDADTTAKQGEIATEKRALEQHVPNGMKLEVFLKITAEYYIHFKIENATRRLKAINDASAIASRKLLSVPGLPSLPAGFVDLLIKSVDGVSIDAAARVRDQVGKHDFHNGGEAWLAEGLVHIVDDDCPCCANALSGNALIDTYRGYFSVAYADHKKAIAAMGGALNAALSANAALKCEQAFKDVMADAIFWKDYCDHQYKAPEAAVRIGSEVQALFSAAKSLLEKKMAAPLEVVSLSTAFIDATANWRATSVELHTASAILADANRSIQEVKDANTLADKAKVEATLTNLQAIKKRHSEPVITLATGYSKLLDEKKTLVEAKDAKKKALDVYDATILDAYEVDINKVLGVFGASFRLA